jgi:hypothetical protein
MPGTDTGPKSDLLFDECVASIKQEYIRLGHSLGWRFLNTPKRTLNPSADVALLSCNPGGDYIDPTHGRESCESGSAYVHEDWGAAPGTAPLQRQVQLMFDWIDRDPDTMLTAYFIPFRSPSFELLPAKQASFDFSVGLWTHITHEVRPRLIVCLGREPERGLRKVFGSPTRVPEEYSVGWGAYTASVTRYPDVTVLRFPHLSRFAIFGRQQSAQPLRELRRAIL